jgi:hypothetical protein
LSANRKQDWHGFISYGEARANAMATVVSNPAQGIARPDQLSGTPRAGFVDRWIYVFTALSFIAITLAGFVPESLVKIDAVRLGQSPPFPLVLHVHAVLMGSFLLLLLAQTILVATGRCDLHRRLGVAAIVLVPAIVVVAFVLVPTTYHSAWQTAHSGPLQTRGHSQSFLLVLDDILLWQLRTGLLFPLFIWIGLRARDFDAGLHKRMLILATAVPLAAGIGRITWLPTTLPGSLVSTDLYTLLAISPMFLWDVLRNRALHRAYAIWIGLSLPPTFVIYALWDSGWWHAVVPRVMGV